MGQTLNVGTTHDYLTGAVGIPKNSFGKHGKLLLATRPLHDFVAHKNGRLWANRQAKPLRAELTQAKQLVRFDPNLSIDNTGRLKIDNGFCESFVSYVDECLTSVGQALSNLSHGKVGE